MPSRWSRDSHNVLNGFQIQCLQLVCVLNMTLQWNKVSLAWMFSLLRWLTHYSTKSFNKMFKVIVLDLRQTDMGTFLSIQFVRIQTESVINWWCVYTFTVVYDIQTGGEWHLHYHFSSRRFLVYKTFCLKVTILSFNF